ncbi:WxL domain-containing protein [Agrilactobacillus fermenti]|uniref:WxL domain-containing protein n=1 Tax=Agrilactobacillus fermenti TaxID=2586909 RepID=UPI001E4CBB27|nr:WxL domain-containing protein [Agrilactobacillus fermenti]MCD2256954.1 WxL domain-containing protein [Agrilactobacillus fermenti]
MKMNKKTLVSSLAVLAAAAGTLAPAAATFAATGAKADGTAWNTIDLSDRPNGTVAAYPSTGDAKMGAVASSGEDKGTATANSEAYVNVKSGILTLDAVPDFDFGDGVAGSTVGLVDNKSVINNDGNARGLLQITDARTTAQQTATGAGYQLKLSVNPFEDGNSNSDAYNASAANAASTDAWKKNFDLSFDDGINSTFTPAPGNSVTLNSGKYQSNAAAKTFLDATTSKGRTKISLGGANEQFIHLDIPEQAQAKTYVSALTWTLTPGH